MNQARGYSKTLALAIVAFWLVMVGLLVKRTYLDYPQSSQTPFPAHIDRTDPILGEEWMGIYMGKGKIGYSVTNIQKGNNTYLISERTLMKFRVMGTPQVIHVFTKSVIDEDFSLRSFRFRFQSGVVKFQAQGKVAGGKMELHIDSGGREIQETIPLKAPTYLPGSLSFVLLRQGLNVGKEWRFPIFDPLTMSNDEIIISIEGEEKVRIGGEKVLAYRLKESFKGVVVRAWISEEGKILKEECPLGMVLIRETREEALTKNWDKGFGAVDTDIILFTAVPVDTPVEKPESVKYLKAKLKGIPLGDFNLTSGRQVLTGDTVEITREEVMDVSSYLLPLKEEGFAKYLEPSLLVQSNDPRIIEEANRIIGDEKNALKVAKMITEWVYENVDKKPTVSIPSALEVLESRVGDCNEHTVLFTALTRAVGVPTRIITGIVFSGGNFYYHTWAEVYVGKWVSVDPTMRQFPVDATHIGFVEGGFDKQLEMMKVVGQLKVEILEYQ